MTNYIPTIGDHYFVKCCRQVSSEEAAHYGIDVDYSVSIVEKGWIGVVREILPDGRCVIWFDPSFDNDLFVEVNSWDELFNSFDVPALKESSNGYYLVKKISGNHCFISTSGEVDEEYIDPDVDVEE